MCGDDGAEDDTQMLPGSPATGLSFMSLASVGGMLGGADVAMGAGEGGLDEDDMCGGDMHEDSWGFGEDTAVGEPWNELFIACRVACSVSASGGGGGGGLYDTTPTPPHHSAQQAHPLPAFFPAAVTTGMPVAEHTPQRYRHEHDEGESSSDEDEQLSVRRKRARGRLSTHPPSHTAGGMI
ncbi:unnamed protein product [Vitrella brassicaformis CCMP3155]|uniref:Uncharacterized protein n=1 Tax=Vitrella brassicaformis (strain CCMP3155) TaxID=1169540 RepID=A0A0G4F1F1_VITBC|nr:unnamed protein product [Vitrella brassicaformis CCMP3155]|eukprot:CEM05215.1 unnamed protein product [Vitrella brassicaformis CCMP3155]